MRRHTRPEAPDAPLRRLLRYLVQRPRWLVLSAASSLVAVGFSLAIPVLVGWAIDALVGPGLVRWEALGALALGVGASALAVALAQWTQGYATSRLCSQCVCRLREDAYRKLGVLPLASLDARPEGDLAARIVNDADAVGDGLLQGLQQLLTGSVTILGTLAIMLWLSPAVTAVVVLATPLSVFVAWLIARLNTQGFREQQRLQGELTAYAQELLQEQRLVTAFCRGEQALQGFEAINRRLDRVGEKAQFGGSLTNPGTRFSNNVIYALVAMAGCLCAVGVLPGGLTVGGVQSFLSYATQYTKPFNDISAVLAQVQTALASADRLFALIDAPEEKPDAPSARQLAREAQGAMAFDHVDFGYVPGRPVLRDLSWQAQPGQHIALVGPTGCGKTTLLNLLLRFYEPESGRITVDGHDVRDVTRASLRSAFGLVLQDTWLFSGTVHDNIAYARPEATRAQVQEAARRARADAFIRQLPQGYDTVIGEGSLSLSQGQRQLLCIARALLQNPSILLLDEATSSLDTRTEALVQEAFDAMVAGRTSLIVAHRLSTIQKADRILVLKDGCILEQGTHQELLDRGGYYATLYASQWQDEEAQEAATAP